MSISHSRDNILKRIKIDSCIVDVRDKTNYSVTGAVLSSGQKKIPKATKTARCCPFL